MNANTSNGAVAESAAAEQYLTFMLNGEEYGVDILRVQEIKGWEPAAAVPNMPGYLTGVINLRGTIIPVMDLRRRLGFEAVPYTATTVTVVLRTRGREERERTMGFIVDAVSEVYDIPAARVQSAPDVSTQVRTDYVKGLALIEGKMIILLDVDRLVNTDETFGDLDGLGAEERPAEAAAP